MEEFPGNQRNSRPENKNVKRIVDGDVVRRKQSMRKRFGQLFVAGDSRTVSQYVFLDVLLPAARDMVADAISQGVERLIFGEVRSTSRRPMSGTGQGYISYNRYSQSSRTAGPPRDTNPNRMSRQARATHNFDEIILSTRREAEEVLNSLYDLIARYDAASVADLYDLVGEERTFADEKWGWSDIKGSGVSRTRDGYLLNLPRPQPID